MLKLSPLLLLLSCSWPIFGQKSAIKLLPNDWERSELRGRVKAVSFYGQDMSDPKMDLGFAEKIWHFNTLGNLAYVNTLDYRGMIIAQEVFGYDVQGRLVSQQEQSQRNSKYPNQIVTKSYDGKGLCVSTQYQYADSSLWYREAHIYNAKNQLVTTLGLSPKLDTFERHEFEYDASGVVGEERYFLQNKLTYKYLYTYDDSLHLVQKHRYEYDGTLADREEYRYNAAGKRVYQAIYDERGRLYLSDVLKYDEQQRQTEQVTYNFDLETRDSALMYKTIYAYDDTRRTTTKTRYNADNQLVDKVISYFNAQHLPILRESVDASGELIWNNKYTYDSTGQHQLVAHRNSVNIVQVDKSIIYGPHSNVQDIWVYSRDWSYQPSRHESFTYTDAGRLIAERVDLLKNVQDRETLKQAQAVLFQEVIYNYNDNNLLLLSKVQTSLRQPPAYMPNAKIDTQTVKYVYEYHPKTRLMTRQALIGPTGDTFEIVAYTYKGKALHTSTTSDGQGVPITFTTYDKKGRPLTIHLPQGKAKTLHQKNTYHKNGLPLTTYTYDSDGKTVIEKIHHEYTFDKQGNWTRHIVTKNDRVSQINQRIFTYYP